MPSGFEAEDLDFEEDLAPSLADLPFAPGLPFDEGFVGAITRVSGFRCGVGELRMQVWCGWFETFLEAAGPDRRQALRRQAPSTGVSQPRSATAAQLRHQTSQLADS